MGRRIRWSWIVAALVGLAWVAPEDALAGRLPQPFDASTP
jgi:hypothetical protein